MKKHRTNAASKVSLHHHWTVPVDDTLLRGRPLLQEEEDTGIRVVRADREGPATAEAEGGRPRSDPDKTCLKDRSPR